jgi:hypothetical protein
MSIVPSGTSWMELPSAKASKNISEITNKKPLYDKPEQKFALFSKEKGYHAPKLRVKQGHRRAGPKNT